MRTQHGARYAVTAALIAGGALLAAGCSSDNGGSSSGSTKVAAVIKGLDNPFFQSMQQGIDAEAQQAGVDATVQAAQSITDTTGQADKLNALAGQDYGCYIVNPISGTNLIQG